MANLLASIFVPYNLIGRRGQASDRENPAGYRAGARDPEGRNTAGCSGGATGRLVDGPGSFADDGEEYQQSGIDGSSEDSGGNGEIGSQKTGHSVEAGRGSPRWFQRERMRKI
jgi:hypothetical protein